MGEGRLDWDLVLLKLVGVCRARFMHHIMQQRIRHRVVHCLVRHFQSSCLWPVNIQLIKLPEASRDTRRNKICYQHEGVVRHCSNGYTNKQALVQQHCSMESIDLVRTIAFRAPDSQTLDNFEDITLITGNANNAPYIRTLTLAKIRRKGKNRYPGPNRAHGSQYRDGS